MLRINFMSGIGRRQSQKQLHQRRVRLMNDWIETRMAWWRLRRSVCDLLLAKAEYRVLCLRDRLVEIDARKPKEPKDG